MSRRGDGIGLEVTTDLVRGVRLSIDEPGRVAAVCEIPIIEFSDDVELFDTLVRTRSRLGEFDVPARVGWFPPTATLQRIEVTGRDPSELNQIRGRLADEHGVNSSMLIDADARRYLLAMRWDHDQSNRLRDLLERAGFSDVAIEPAPVALQRVQPTGSTIVRRDAGDHTWAAVVGGSVPVAASTIESDGREAPTIISTDVEPGLNRLDSALPQQELAGEVSRLAADALGAVAPGSETDVHLHVLGELYPPFPAHDLRAPQRVGVALGAAVGAAGLAGRLQPVHVVTSVRPVDSGLERPWAIERLAAAPAGPSGRGPSLWVRLKNWLRAQ